MLRFYVTFYLHFYSCSGVHTEAQDPDNSLKSKYVNFLQIKNSCHFEIKVLRLTHNEHQAAAAVADPMHLSFS